jgi:V/A-type H+-transporting ATPase subunit K
MIRRESLLIRIAGMVLLFGALFLAPDVMAEVAKEGGEAVVKAPLSMWAPIGAGLAIGLAALATGIAQARIGAAGIGAVAENPKRLGIVIMLVAIPETVAILGFVIAYLILNPAS